MMIVIITIFTNYNTYATVEEGKILFSTIAKPGMFGLSMAPKDNFLDYSTQFI